MNILDNWIKRKHGISTRAELDDWQRERVEQTIAYAKANSSFYRRLYESDPCAFTDAHMIAEHGLEMVCVSQSIISRVVTLNTSGTTAKPKRVFFTTEDQELTVDFFAEGMCTLVKPGDTTAIFLPCTLPGSVGDLLAIGLERAGVKPLRFGIITDFKEAAECIAQADNAVAMPAQMLTLAYYCKENGVPLKLRNVLLSADSSPKALRKQLERITGAEVFDHWGMTETGLGGAIECDKHSGMHIRENDLLLEVINPETGEFLLDGNWGELVFTTLTRNGMPLIKYRTGDRACIMSGCECGSMLRTVRLAGRIDAPKAGGISLTELDEMVFAIDGVGDYIATFDSNKNVLRLRIFATEDCKVLSYPLPGAAEVLPLLSAKFCGKRFIIET